MTKPLPAPLAVLRTVCTRPLAGLALAVTSAATYGRPALTALWSEVVGWSSREAALAAYADPFGLLCSGVALGGAVAGGLVCLGLALRRRS